MNCKQRVHRFWDAFLKQREELETALREADAERIEELRGALDRQLERVCGCKVEIERDEEGFFELSFDTGPNKTVQYIAALLKDTAPKELVEDWIINACLPPLSAKAKNAVLRIKDRVYTGADFTVFYEIDAANKCLHTQVYCPGFADIQDEERKRDMAAYMLELFLGELELEARIGSVAPLDEPLADSENFCLLPNFYEDVCDIIIDQEWLEYHDPTQIYMAFKVNEKPVHDTLRQDIKLLLTTNALLQEEVLRQNEDSCKDFKDKGGEYGYLYYENPYADEKNALIRQTMEKKLNDMLYPIGVARTIGGAIGEHYSYIDVAIFDPDAFAILLEHLNDKLSFPMYYQPFYKSV